MNFKLTEILIVGLIVTTVSIVYLFIQNSVSTILIDVTPFVITIDVETG